MSAEWPLAKQGKKGVAVRALQRLLLHRGAEVDVDGSFGPATAEAVKEFQSANGLDADGKFGPHTEKAIRRFQKRVHLAVDGVVGPHTWQLLIVENQGQG